MKKLLLASAAVTALAGAVYSSDTGKILEKAAEEILRQSPEGKKILADFNRYKKLASIFKKYHDSKTLDDKDLLTVLKETGVIKSGKKEKGKKEPQQKPYYVPKYSGKYRWPMDAGIVSSEFGPRWGKQHQGLDIAADTGVPIKAIAPGEVIYSGDGISGYGNVIILRHDQDTTTTYAHNKALKVKLGQKVTSGQLIALLGSTGHSTGPHLHFEFRKADKPVNPRNVLPKSKF